MAPAAVIVRLWFREQNYYYFLQIRWQSTERKYYPP